MAITAYEKLPVPGFESPTATYTNPEILFSTKGGFTQNGVTLAGGQGVIPAGTVLAQKTADKKYYVYDNAAVGTGLEVAMGILRTSVDLGAPGSPDQQGNLVITGILKLNMLSGADGSAITDLGATVNTVRNTFRF